MRLDIEARIEAEGIASPLQPGAIAVIVGQDQIDAIFHHDARRPDRSQRHAARPLFLAPVVPRFGIDSHGRPPLPHRRHADDDALLDSELRQLHRLPRGRGQQQQDG